MSDLGPLTKFSVLIVENPKFGCPRFIYLVPTNRWSQVCCRGSPLAPTRCIPVALGFERRESVSNLETRVEFPVLNRIKPKVWGSRLASCANAHGRISPLSPTKCLL